jgi:arginine/serine-rich splicing factor 17
MDEEERAKERAKAAESQLKEKRRQEREERRRLKKAKGADDEDAMARKIAVEETKLLIAQRKLESIRLLDELLQRVKAKMEAKDSVRNLEADLLKAVAKEAKARPAGKDLVTSSLTSCKEQDEKALRDKLISRLKDKESKRVEYCGQKIRSVLDEVSIRTVPGTGMQEKG